MRAILAILTALALTLGVAAASASVASATPECSPGQHGNGHPGFKPGVCK